MSVKRLDDRARWFAGKGRTVVDVSEVAGAAGLSTMDVRYADGAQERYLDIPEPFDWGALLTRLREAPVGGLELRPAPGLETLTAAGLRDQRVPATDQSNTLVALDERLLVKAYRRLAPGAHPEVELLSALAGRAAPVPPFAGSIHWVDDSGDTAVALLQAFVPEAEAGWEAPIERVAATLRGEPFDASEWHAAGRVAGDLHRALAEAFEPSAATVEHLRRWRAEAEAALAEAARSDAEVAERAAEVSAELAAIERSDPPMLTRIHGDLHVAQLLRVPGGDPLVIDFEGDPTRPFSDRLGRDTPLRDLASLLRSVDHVGSAASRRAGDAEPRAWIAAARSVVLDSYTDAAPVPVDHDLLAALELAKECSEFVYAQRMLPEWLYAPRLGLRRLLEDT